MYFLASKTIGFFIVPSNFIVCVMLLGLLLWQTRFSRFGKRLLVTGIVLLVLGGATPLGAALLLPLENRFPPWDPSRGAPSGIIVLGGAIGPEVSARRGNIALDGSAERPVAAVELYRRYPTVRIVFAGGNANLVFDGPSEAEFAARFFEKLGIPRNQVVLEAASRNTMENAVNTKRLVNPKPGERWLLVTSASHMPRAIGLFRKAGFAAEAYPVDWLTSGWDDLTKQSFSFLGGFEFLDRAAHEWAGLIVDRMSGRTSELFPGP